MMTFVMNDGHDYKRFWILKIQFIDPVHKTLYILLEGRNNTEANYITDNIRNAFISMGVVEKSLLSEITKCEFDKWHSVAYHEAVISVFKETHYFGDMVQELLEKKAKLGIEKTNTVHIYYSVYGVVATYFKSIKSDETEKKTMFTEYYILRVNHLQKVCYVILGDIPGFKALKTADEIRSYFEINNIDICTMRFHVSFDVYQEWIQILVSQDLIEMNSLYDSVLDDTQLSSIKRHITSIKYELEIEPNATIRTYNCDTPEMIFNEWFNDVSQSDKRKEKGMSDNTVSPALSKIEERIKQLKQLERDNNDVAIDIQKHKNAIEELTFKHDELDEDISYINRRIQHLLHQARIEEGFTKEYLSRFIKERGY